MLTTLLVLITLGLVSGFFAGLLGIGGGAVMVPVLTGLFLAQGHAPEVVVHLALGTSMSCIIINALISIRTHHQHQAILWPIVRTMAPMVILGSSLAAFWVVRVESQTIALIFLVLMLLVAAQLAFQIQPKSSQAKPLGWPQLIPAGLVIGSLSSMIAIGGGSLTVPFLNAYQVNIKHAIATAAALGLPLAVAATLVFIWQGLEQSNLPPHSLGYVYWPATICVASGAAITTAAGAHLTHRLPVRLLKKIFAVLIVMLAIRMYLGLN